MNEMDKKKPVVTREGVEEIYRLLRKGDEQMKLSSGGEVVLLLGNTGAGKSTLAQFLTGGDVESVEIGQGTGEYKVVDHNNKISGNSTIISQTIFPDLFYDPKTNTTFYDCPGFADTRSAGHEIATTYFIKKVIDHSNSVKLVFVANHNSLREGADRNDFVKLLNHATDFVKQVENYRNGIALITTKVDSKYNRMKLIPDETVISGIATFLERVITDIKTKPPSRKWSETTVLLESLLHKDDGIYSRIGIFRRPDEPGKLADIDTLKIGKMNMEKIISQNLKFVKVKESDFGYSITSDAKLYIGGLMEEIYHDMAEIFTKLSNEMERIYEKQEPQMTEITKIEEFFKTLYESFLKIENDAIGGNTTTQEFKHEIYKNIETFKADIRFDYREEIEKKEDYVKFFNSMSNTSEKNKSPELSSSLRKLLDYLNYSSRYYALLNHLYERLSQYDIQKDKNKYLKEDITKLSDIAHSSMKEAVGNILREYSNIIDIKLNPPKLNWLKNILTTALKNEIEYTWHPSSSTLIVKGRFIKLSEVDIEKGGTLKRSIYIFALEKVFIDTTLDLTGKTVQLAIVSPVWHVQGSQSIILDGESAREHHYRKSRNGIEPGEHGSDGMPGYHGGPAGSFLGIGTEVIDEEYLTISATGGKGSRGQDGGDGKTGLDGKDCKTCLVIYKDNLKMYFVYNERDDIYYGLKGGNGGDGGRGGLGGHKGDVSFIEVGRNTKKLKVKIVARNGADGENGKGGAGGSGGRFYKYSMRSYLIVLIGDWSRMDRWAESGSNGRDGHKELDIQNPWKVNNSLSTEEVKRHYVSYLEDNLNNHPKETSLRTFLQHINSNVGSKRIRRFIGEVVYESHAKQFEDQLDISSVSQKLNFSESLMMDNQTHRNRSVDVLDVKHLFSSSNNESHFKNRIPPRAVGEVKEQITNDVSQNGNDDGFFVTSGSTSLNKNVNLNNLFVFVLERFSPINPWNLIKNLWSDGPILDFQRSMSSSDWFLPSRSEDKNVLAFPLNSGYSNNDVNVCEGFQIDSLHSNLLLWNTILKKVTGKNRSPSIINKCNYEEGMNFATNLAYRYYTPPP